MKRSQYTVLNFKSGEEPNIDEALDDISYININGENGLRVDESVENWVNKTGKHLLYDQALVSLGEGCSIEFYNCLMFAMSSNNKNTGIISDNKPSAASSNNAVITVLQPNYGLSGLTKFDSWEWDYVPFSKKQAVNSSNHRVVFKLSDNIEDNDFYQADIDFRPLSVVIAPPIGMLTHDSRHLDVYKLTSEFLGQLNKESRYLVSAYNIVVWQDLLQISVGHAALTMGEYIPDNTSHALEEKYKIGCLSLDASSIFSEDKKETLDSMKKLIHNALFAPSSDFHWNDKNKLFRIFGELFFIVAGLALEGVAVVFKWEIAIGIAPSTPLWIIGVVVLPLVMISFILYERYRFLADEAMVFNPGRFVAKNPSTSEELLDSDPEVFFDCSNSGLRGGDENNDELSDENNDELSDENNDELSDENNDELSDENNDELSDENNDESVVLPVV